MTNQALISDLRKRTEWTLDAAIALRELPEKALRQREAPARWNALECLDHLNRYGSFYLPEIARAIQSAKTVPASQPFATGWLGNKFAISMLPGEAGTSMKTFKSMDSLGAPVDYSTLEKFIEQQREILRLLPLCERVNLSKVKTGITLTRFIRLRLGDTLRVVIYHNQRHLEQAQRAAAIGAQEVESI